MDRETGQQAPQPISRELAREQGKTRYFPGLRCYKGHLSERYVSNGMCIQCAFEKVAARRAGNAPQRQEYEMPSPSTWQFVEKGRYALEYQGRVLQAVTNPNRDDKRRYIAVVDRTPLGAAHSLNEAKTKAIRHVQHQLSKTKAERLFQPGLTGPYHPQPHGPETAALAALRAAENGVPQPFPTDAPQPGAVQQPAPDPVPDPVQEVPQPQPVVQSTAPERQPEPEPAPQPVANLPAGFDPGPDAVTALFTVRVAGPDVVSALSALQAAADMLRELGTVDCQITLPREIRL